MSLTLIATRCTFHGARLYIEDKPGAADGLNYKAEQQRADIQFDGSLKTTKIEVDAHGKEKGGKEEGGK